MDIIGTVELFDTWRDIRDFPEFILRNPCLFFQFTIRTLDIGFIGVPPPLWKSPFRCRMESRFLPEKVC